MVDEEIISFDWHAPWHWNEIEMPEYHVKDLTLDQVRNLNKVLKIFGDPSLKEEIPPIVVVLDAAKLWYLQRQQDMRREG